MNLLLDRSPKSIPYPKPDSTPSKSSFSKPDAHDIAFESICQTIQSLKSSFQQSSHQRAELLRIQKWMRRLKAKNFKYIAQKRNRNTYGKLLVNAMMRGRLDMAPFHVGPPRMEDPLPSLPAHQVASVQSKPRTVYISSTRRSSSALVERKRQKSRQKKKRPSSAPRKRSALHKSKGLHAHRESDFTYSHGTPTGKRSKDDQHLSFVTRDGQRFSSSVSASSPSRMELSQYQQRRQLFQNDGDSNSEISTQSPHSAANEKKSLRMVPSFSDKVLGNNSTLTQDASRYEYEDSYDSNSTRTDPPLRRISVTQQSVSPSSTRSFSTRDSDFAPSRFASPQNKHRNHGAKVAPMRVAPPSPLIQVHNRSPSPSSSSHQHEEVPSSYGSGSTPSSPSTATSFAHRIPRPEPIQVANSAFSSPSQSPTSGADQNHSSSKNALILEKQKNRMLQEEISSLRRQLLEAKNHISSLEQDLQKKDEECEYVIKQSLHDDRTFMERIEAMLDQHGKNLTHDRNLRQNGL